MNKQSDQYYGGFFWLSLISFVVPLFVAYAAFSKITPTTKPEVHPDPSGVDQNLWDYLLRKYVVGGLVDYDGMSKDYLFTTYLKQLSAADPAKLATRDQRLALHCNAYNALVINGVVSHKIHINEQNVLKFTPKPVADEIERLKEQIEALKRRPNVDAAELDEFVKRADKLRAESQFFKLKEHLFANRTLSLDELEHQIIRPTFEEPRIHVALVCAANSCPPLRGEAFVGERIEAQLQDLALQFANNERFVRFDQAKNTLYLSPILKWYSVDWEAAGGYLNWLAERVESDELKVALTNAETGEVAVVFNDYDWGLNAQAGSTRPADSGGGFGSGSIPNE